MAFLAVLDANVLFPWSLRDSLLRLAEIVVDDDGYELATLYLPVWSDRILDEMRKNVIAVQNVSPEKADRIVAKMQETFPEAAVPPAKIAALEPAMTNDPKDRHVLAAAVAANAEIIVTDNLKDFPKASTEPYGIEAMSADAFLCSLLDLDPRLVEREIRQQAADLTKTPKTYDQLLDDHLIKMAPKFVAKLRSI